MLSLCYVILKYTTYIESVQHILNTYTTHIESLLMIINTINNNWTANRHHNTTSHNTTSHIHNITKALKWKLKNFTNLDKINKS